MKLYLNATSPFARMVRIVAEECNLNTPVELIWCDPWANDEALLAVNPMGRIPTLVTDDDVVLVEAPLIAQYLSRQAAQNRLMPEQNEAEVLHLLGLAQGVMEASFNLVISRKHQGGEADQSVMGKRRFAAIDRCLRYFEKQIEAMSPNGQFNVGDIALGVALDYIHFRLSELNIDQKYPRLEKWRKEKTQRPSFSETAFS